MYLARTLIFLAFAILIEILLYYFEFRDETGLKSFFGGKNVHLGWANANLVASIYLVIIPMTAYYFTKKQKIFNFIIFIGIEMFALLLLLSRGAYLALLIAVIPLMIKFFIKMKDKMKFFKTIILTVILLEVITILYLIPSGIVNGFYNVLDSKGLSLIGREVLIKVGLSVFGRYPLFGGGANTSQFYLQVVSSEVFYHNYLVETLATIGIFGFASFMYYLYHIIKQIVQSDDFNNYVGIVVISLIVQGMFDTTFYNPIVMIFLSIVLPMMVNSVKLNEERGNLCIE
jgi:O-antigen ligase